ncbi:MAG: Coenzyme F420 hydrogenase/dehydrogenase, beta subunit C-terminal domain [Desulfobacterium sp.]|nr:Coenzyme F420 hydrogenase/dehydrogenase, beta subunit C-terminal domain [Desulfobacterium sp.]
MEETYEIRGTNWLDSVQKLLASVFETSSVTSMLVPVRHSTTHVLMPTLVSDPGELEGADPFAPCFPLNSAKLVSKLTKKHSNEIIAAVLRPCELRALVELVKIKQATMDNLITISFDCAGAYPNREYNRTGAEGKAAEGKAKTLGFMEQRLGSKLDDDTDKQLSTSCRICTGPFPENADLCITLLDHDPGALGVFAGTDRGRELIMGKAFEVKSLPGTRADTVKEVLQRKKEAAKKVFEDLAGKTATMAGLGNYLASCVNCYNCRVACPVCFCRECVFNTDVFDYEPFQYAAWAKNKGTLRMPMDTVFFHLTRMIHMGLSCVGCGQCSNACPNDIRVAELFTAVGKGVQQGFGYEAGKSMDDPFPLSVFFEDEFQDVTGI